MKGVKSLAKSLQTLVAADALEGNNQYSCENCGSKQDADRQFCIRTLPPCLRINLQRFVFDWQSLTKQKVWPQVVVELLRGDVVHSAQ